MEEVTRYRFLAGDHDSWRIPNFLLNLVAGNELSNEEITHLQEKTLVEKEGDCWELTELGRKILFYHLNSYPIGEEYSDKEEKNDIDAIIQKKRKQA